MPWAEPYEIDFLNSRVQEFQDSMNSKSARAKFWENLRRDWKAQWDLPDKKNSRLSSHFRDEMRRRGVTSKRVNKPKKRVNKATKPVETAPNLATTATESITIYRRRLVPLASPSRPSSQHSPTPVPSSSQHSPTPGPSRARRHSPTPVPPSSHRSPTPAHTPTPAQSRFRLQSPTPPVPYSLPSPASSHHSTSPSPFRVWTERVPSSQSPSPCPLPMPPTAGNVPVSPPAKILQHELSKSLAFHLELPGVTRSDIDLIIQGQRVSVSAQTNEVSYKWSTDVGGQVIPESVRSGFADGVLRIIMNVTGTAKVTNAWRSFLVSDTCPSW